MEEALATTARFVKDKAQILFKLGDILPAITRFVAVDLLQLDEKVKAIIGTKRKMEKLKESSAMIIDTAIQHIESRSFIDDSMKELLQKLKYLAYDLEDVVDYYDTKVLQKKQRSNTTFLRPVRDFFSVDNQIVFNSKVGGIIKDITECWDSIFSQNSNLSNLLQGSIPLPEPSLYNRETHSRNSFDVIGRELEKNIIVDMLTTDGGSLLKVITIVGMGGLGKTTLAQLVFNDQRVKAHFESSRMWTVVGAEFDHVKIMKAVLELATDAPVNISQIDSVRKSLEKALSEKKFLLVLDDVWNEDRLKWGVLKAALTCGARGSKILVTTRSQQVSLIMDSSSTTHQIQQLSRNDCLSLFQQFAFGDQTADQNLMKFGEEIIEKCGGVPLAAISLGSMLRSTRDETYWSSVSNSEIWQSGNEEDKVLAVLKLSYDTLPSQSKKCFAFASLFSKNYTMERDLLIQLWIANGFVRSEGNFDAETVGKRVFDNLVMGSFFLSAPSHAFEEDSHVTKCRMHDLMHDLARSVSADVYWNSDQDSVEDIRVRTYHLQIYERKLPNMTQVLDKKPLYLRTFMPFMPIKHRYAFSSFISGLSINLLEVFSELKFLRVLDLTDGGIWEVPTSIENLIHLRYLNLSKNKIEVLPDSITLLCNLQYLNLSFNEALQKLPKELGKMQNLRDLDIQNDIRLTHMPCGLFRLTNLRSLPLFIAGDKADTCSIIELEDLKLRGKMKIKFSKDFQNYSCGGRKILKNKDLNELWLEFNGLQINDMLDDLCPNMSLKKLTICNYVSPQFPAWLMKSQLPNLVEVSLVRCSGFEKIPPFGNLQFLKKLDLTNVVGITDMGDEFHGNGGFPSLQELFLIGMDDLQKWSNSHHDVFFPKLQSLIIIDCKKLETMPRLPTIQHLEISNCANESILSCIGELTSLSVLKVEDVGVKRNLTSFPIGCFRTLTSLPIGCLRNLTSLTELQIIKLRQLRSLPGDEMQHLKMLRSLTIKMCDNLESIPLEVGPLSSLRFLRLSDCPSIKLQPEELVQILNSVDKFRIEICHRNVNLHGQLQNLQKLEELTVCRHHVPHNFMIEYRASRRLSICCCDELESLMTAAPVTNMLQQLKIHCNLTTLPDWLQHLKSLRLLAIEDCPWLEKVPEVLKNLHMLEELQIVGCPQLKSKCERDKGEDWSIISHVPHVHIE